jgi:hypothetical protein
MCIRSQTEVMIRVYFVFVVYCATKDNNLKRHYDGKLASYYAIPRIDSSHIGLLRCPNDSSLYSLCLQNTICHCQQLRSIPLLFNSKSTSTIESIFRVIRPERTISLTLANDYWGNDGTNLFFSLFNSLEFTRLRSLIIKQIRDKNLEHLLKSLILGTLISLSVESSENKYDQTWIVVSYLVTSFF